MKGTSISQTFEMDWMPPKMTSAVKNVMTAPLIQGEMWKVSWTRTAIELAWTVLPIPNAATAVNTSSSGNGNVRKIVQQSIPANVTPSFAASSFTLNVA